jgi:hypothetical protein
MNFKFLILNGGNHLADMKDQNTFIQNSKNACLGLCHYPSQKHGISPVFTAPSVSPASVIRAGVPICTIFLMNITAMAPGR